jgi:putative PIN family toxin of toxin-antitoxin system
MSTVPRVVVDTNILVAYALLAERAARRDETVRRCMEVVLDGCELLASDATLAELRAVLLRSDFDRYKPAAERESFLVMIGARARTVVPADIGRLCRDPEDDMFLAVALAADADWLITVDRQLLSVREVGRARIVRPPRFLAAVVGPADPPPANRQSN